MPPARWSPYIGQNPVPSTGRNEQALRRARADPEARAGIACALRCTTVTAMIRRRSLGAGLTPSEHRAAPRDNEPRAPPRSSAVTERLAAPRHCTRPRRGTHSGELPFVFNRVQIPVCTRRARSGCRWHQHALGSEGWGDAGPPPDDTAPPFGGGRRPDEHDEAPSPGIRVGVATARDAGDPRELPYPRCRVLPPRRVLIARAIVFAPNDSSAASRLCEAQSTRTFSAVESPPLAKGRS